MLRLGVFLRSRHIGTENVRAPMRRRVAHRRTVDRRDRRVTVGTSRLLAHMIRESLSIVRLLLLLLRMEWILRRVGRGGSILTGRAVWRRTRPDTRQESLEIIRVGHFCHCALFSSCKRVLGDLVVKSKLEANTLSRCSLSRAKNEEGGSGKSQIKSQDRRRKKGKRQRNELYYRWTRR
jgi:hypothetical protein